MGCLAACALEEEHEVSEEESLGFVGKGDSIGACDASPECPEMPITAKLEITIEHHDQAWVQTRTSEAIISYDDRNFCVVYTGSGEQRVAHSCAIERSSGLAIAWMSHAAMKKLGRSLALPMERYLFQSIMNDHPLTSFRFTTFVSPLYPDTEWRTTTLWNGGPYDKLVFHFRVTPLPCCSDE